MAEVPGMAGLPSTADSLATPDFQGILDSLAGPDSRAAGVLRDRANPFATLDTVHLRSGVRVFRSALGCACLTAITESTRGGRRIGPAIQDVVHANAGDGIAIAAVDHGHSDHLDMGIRVGLAIRLTRS